MINIVVMSSKMLLTESSNVFASTGHHILSSFCFTHLPFLAAGCTQKKTAPAHSDNCGSVNHACNTNANQQAVLSGVVVFVFVFFFFFVAFLGDC